MSGLVLSLQLVDFDEGGEFVLLVDSSFALRLLHEAIQVVFDWTDSHLWNFTGSDGVVVEMDQGSEIGIERLLDKVGDAATYHYDYGDEWEVSVVVKEKLKTETEHFALMKAAGFRGIDDVGGVPGLKDLFGLASRAFRGQKVTREDNDLLEHYTGQRGAAALSYLTEPRGDEIQMKLSELSILHPFPSGQNPELQYADDLEFSEPNSALLALRELVTLGQTAEEMSGRDVDELSTAPMQYLRYVREHSTPLTPSGYIKPSALPELMAAIGLDRPVPRKERDLKALYGLREWLQLTNQLEEYGSELRVTSVGHDSIRRGLIPEMVMLLFPTQLETISSLAQELARQSGVAPIRVLELSRRILPPGHQYSYEDVTRPTLALVEVAGWIDSNGALNLKAKRFLSTLLNNMLDTVEGSLDAPEPAGIPEIVNTLCEMSPMFKTLFGAVDIATFGAELSEENFVRIGTHFAPLITTALQTFSGKGIPVPWEPDDQIDPRLTTMLLDSGVDMVSAPELTLLRTVVECLEFCGFIVDARNDSHYVLSDLGNEVLREPYAAVYPILGELLPGDYANENFVVLLDALASLIGRTKAARLLGIEEIALNVTLSQNSELPFAQGRSQQIPDMANVLRDFFGLQKINPLMGDVPQLTSLGRIALTHAVGERLREMSPDSML
ncbi:IS1096 element passenger TnpR family protein [Corynebacterium sp. S7]